MKAIHNNLASIYCDILVVVYPKDTEKWKQFTTSIYTDGMFIQLLCIPKILKNESNSQLINNRWAKTFCCCVSQRYWKMKAIHNLIYHLYYYQIVVVYPKDTEKWKQFTTAFISNKFFNLLLCIPKILKNESNSQHKWKY